ncbi:hypothetical protein EVAR_9656_1 [Eumeta japonica]|uniref:Uncharacterized protein n=1 Tax=Eumeta variegata TaxID=151549 RepID=A0A4C1TKY5_EUMVA|nr:hypothetical protein EVAR_9656_1 [Eumeta japonica]
MSEEHVKRQYTAGIQSSDEVVPQHRISYRPKNSSNTSERRCCAKKSAQDDQRVAPHNLSDEQEAAHVRWCRSTLKRFNGGENPNNTVSGDVLWIVHMSLKENIWISEDELKSTTSHYFITGTKDAHRRLIHHDSFARNGN